MSLSQCFPAANGGNCGSCIAGFDQCRSTVYLSPLRPFAPPAAVNDAALSSGSGQVRAVGGAPFQTLGEVFASLPPGEFVGDVYRVYEAKAVRAVSAIPVKKSNLDQFGKLVQKGLTVSYHGVRGRVAKVSRGACCVEYMHFTGRLTGSCEWLDCELVQVVS